METKCQLITKANQIMTNMVYVEYRDEIKIIKSEHISFNSNEITQYKILGEHIKYRRKQNHSLGHTISGMVDWKQLLASDNPSEQRDIQAEIASLEERILNPDPELVYAVTEEESQFYQHEIIPNIWYPYTNELVEQSQRNAWFRNLVEQFLNGQLEENMFVMQLEKRIRMMQMEGGII